MGIQEIEKDVMDAARKDAEKSIRDAEKEAQDILRKAKRELETAREQAIAAMQKSLAQEERRELEAARFEKTTTLLRAKRQLIDDAIANALDALDAIAAKKRKEHLSALLKKASKEITVASVIVSKKDIPYIEGVKAHEGNVKGGLIAIDASGTLRVDLSYDTLFQSVVEESRADVSKALFGGEQ